MPSEIVNAFTALAPLVDKLGVVGLLVFAVVGLIWERLRLVKQGAKTFRQRDAAKLIQERYRAQIIATGQHLPTIDDILKEYGADLEES